VLGIRLFLSEGNAPRFRHATIRCEFALNRERYRELVLALEPALLAVGASTGLLLKVDRVVLVGCRLRGNKPEAVLAGEFAEGRYNQAAFFSGSHVAPSGNLLSCLCFYGNIKTVLRQGGLDVF